MGGQGRLRLGEITPQRIITAIRARVTEIRMPGCGALVLKPKRTGVN
jgi:hypothetical protein